MSGCAWVKTMRTRGKEKTKSQLHERVHTYPGNDTARPAQIDDERAVESDGGVGAVSQVFLLHLDRSLDFVHEGHVSAVDALL